MNRMSLFVDGSVNSELKIGFGAYLLVSERDIAELSHDEIKRRIHRKKFEPTSSTKLELETVVWSLEEIEKTYGKTNIFFKITIYTDSQCIAGLPARRFKLERNQFKSGAKKRELNHSSLYQRFYQCSDRLLLDVIKVKGHSKTITQNKIHHIFSYVDKVSRKELKGYLKKIRLKK